MTTHNLKNPSVIPVPDPIDLDLAIQRVQTKLSGAAWLEKIFGRAREIPRKTLEGRTERIPMVYQSNGEYYPPLPNDALKSYSFFMAGQPRSFVDHKPHNYLQYVSSPLALIVWGNLKKIDPSLDYIYTERLLNDVVSLLNSVSNLELGRVFDENAREIFRGITINESHLGLLMHPYFAFRIEFMLTYQMTCPSPAVP